MREYSRRIYNLAKGFESLSKEEHGLFFDTTRILGLSKEVKEAAVVLYLDFKDRPVGQYNASHKGLAIFVIASISLAAKAMGDLRTDQEFESKMFVSREKLADAEDRILRSLRVQNTVISLSDVVLQLTKRQIQSMADSFAEHELMSISERDDLVRRANHYLDTALENGLDPKMSYRGRAAGAVFKAVRDTGLHISEVDVARAAGLSRRSMLINAKAIGTLLKNTTKNSKR